MSREKLEFLAQLIKTSHNIVVFTGAGVSTESGVPDFRSPGGIWDRFDPEEMTFQKFVSSPESRRKYWELFRVCWHEFKGVYPNPAHLAIAELEKQGKLSAVITQNVEALHQKAANSEKKFWNFMAICGRFVALNVKLPIPGKKPITACNKEKLLKTVPSAVGFSSRQPLLLDSSCRQRL